MSLFETIEKDYVQAYKAKDAVRLTVLRLLKTAVKNRLVDLCRPGGTLDDAEMLDLIIKEGKQRQDSIEQYTSAGRQDLADKEAAELAVIQGYLPKPLTEEELTALIDATIAEVGATSPREMGKVIDTYGAESIWVTQGTGRDINGYGPLMARYLGTPNYGTGFLSGIACYAPRRFSTSLKSGGLFIADYSQYMPDRYDDPRWRRPDYILIWGNNPVVANSDGTLGHWVVECMKRGSKLITIDPKLTWLAGKSDVFLQLRPGTDTAIALAICNHIVANNLQDQEFCDCWCYGYNEFAEHLKPYTPEWAAPICGVDVDLIKEAAIKIGEAESCCLQWGVAMDHTSEGFVTGMAAYDLMALTGNFEKPGTMVNAPFAFGVNIPWSAGDDWELCTRDLPNQDKKICGNWPANKAMQAISPDDLLVAMETGEPYPIKMGFYAGNNLMNREGIIIPGMPNFSLLEGEAITLKDNADEASYDE